MKTTFFTLTLLLGMSLGAFAKEDSRTVYLQTGKYEIDQIRPNISLPTHFGKPFIIDKSDLNKLNSNEIYQVDLIYTQYKSSESFDQNRLNENRVNQLKKLISTIDRDSPVWNYIEQTTAKDYETAKTYFHGFVIHYKPTSIDYNDLKSKFESYHTQSKTYQLTGSESKEFTYSSGTKIHVPTNAVTYANGTAVKGDYYITYCEFRTPGDIALSGIPMKFEVDGKNSNFSSVGMYEIRGHQNGKQLTLKKPIVVDFNCTKVVDDASFYQLSDKTSKWEQIQPISKEDFSAVHKTTSKNDIIFETAPMSSMPDQRIERDLGTITSRNVSKNKVEMKLDSIAWEKYLTIKNEEKIKSMIRKEIKSEKIVHVHFEGSETFKNSILVGMNPVIKGQLGAVLQANIFADKGHTYPTIVRGLQSSKFGVYNCDQTYRMGRTKTIHPKYVDAGTNTVILTPDVACLIDLNYNGSFSFDPNYVTLNPEGKNALLLFTKNKEMYLVLPHQFNLNELDQKHPTIEMHNVTEKVKSSKDLQALLYY